MRETVAMDEREALQSWLPGGYHSGIWYSVVGRINEKVCSTPPREISNICCRRTQLEIGDCRALLGGGEASSPCGPHSLLL